MTPPIRVLVPVDAYDAESFRLALGYAQKICEKVGSQDVILLTHTKNQLSHTSLSRFLGPAALKALDKGAMALSWGGRLSARTMKTFRYSARNAVVIVYYAEPKIFDFVDGLTNVAGVVAVPDIAGEADAWVARWGAIVHGQAQQPPPSLINDAIFVRALETLSSVVNLTTGLGHPRDKDMANEILRILRAKGHADQSANIKSWAIRRGWRPDAAAELETLAKKIWSLKTKPSLSAIYNANGRYQHWQGEA
ncbi:hypothetical protein [Phenylobacterium sp.]|uniref:hypothetical protein n=1 Tax=Phenylobacterium sp. TaxID=1871053 RepID=UPI0035AE3020